MADQLTRFAGSVSLASGLAAVLIGTLMFVSWATRGDAALASISAGIVMKTNTALGLLLIGLAVLALRPEPTPAVLTIAGWSLAVIVLLLGAATLSQHLVGWDVEWVLLQDAADDDHRVRPHDVEGGPCQWYWFHCLSHDLVLRGFIV